MGLKICFHVLNAYSLFDKTTRYSFGGAELRASIFAAELAKDESYKVDFITLNHGQKEFQKLKGVNLIADRFYNAENFSQPNPRLFKKIIAKLNRLTTVSSDLRTSSLIKSSADAYILFGISGLNKRVVDFCANAGKKLVLFFASDEELNLSDDNFLDLDTLLIKRTIECSDLIVCQNNFQKEKLHELFGKKGSVLLNPIDVNVEFSDKSSDIKKKIIWIGKSNKVKDPLLFVHLAKLNPDKDFIMFCSKSDEHIHRELKQHLPCNMLLFDAANNEDVEEALISAHILISTSLKEGFANVFLMAGKYSLPIITTMVDPNDYIKTHKCGFVCEREISSLSQKLNELYNNSELFRQSALNHYSYVKKNHSTKAIVSKFKSLLSTSCA